MIVLAPIQLPKMASSCPTNTEDENNIIIYLHGFTAHGSPHTMTWRNHFDMGLFPAG
jgi:hypothetical protein